MNWLVSLISSGAVKAFGDAVIAPLIAAIGRKQDAELEALKARIGAGKEVTLASLQAEAEAARIRAALYQAQWGWAGFRWLMFAAALPPILHSGAVYLDSTFRFGWQVARAPGVYEGQELQIIAALIGYSVLQTTAGGFLTWLNRR